MAEYNGKHLVQIQNLLQLAARHVSDMAELTQSVVDAITAVAVDMKGASSTEDGKGGFVPAPEAGAQEKFLRGDGTWQDVELPVATKDTLGVIKVGDYLDIDADGTISGKTLYDTIAASVAVKSEARLVWNYAGVTKNQTKQYSYQIPDGIDYLHISVGGDGSTYTSDIARGGTVSGTFGRTPSYTTTATISFSANGLLYFNCASSVVETKIALAGYHYPTLAELLTETQAAQADTDALMVDQEYRVTLLELGITDDSTTDTETT